MGFFMMEGEGEAFIDGKWVPAHVGPTPERQAAGGIPITKFGEGSLGIWFFAVPGSTMNMESIPYGLGLGSKLLKKLAPGSMERVNISIQRYNEAGKKVIAEAGGREAYDAMARKKRAAQSPSPDLSDKKGIVFGE